MHAHSVDESPTDCNHAQKNLWADILILIKSLFEKSYRHFNKKPNLLWDVKWRELNYGLPLAVNAVFSFRYCRFQTHFISRSNWLFLKKMILSKVDYLQMSIISFFKVFFEFGSGGICNSYMIPNRSHGVMDRAIALQSSFNYILTDPGSKSHPGYDVCFCLSLFLSSSGMQFSS